MAPNISISQSLNKLGIILFWEIEEEGNHMMLDANYNPEKVYTEEEQDFIEEAWYKLYDEFFELRKDSKARKSLRDRALERDLLRKINLLISMREHLTKLYEVFASFPMETFEELKYAAYQTLSKIERVLDFTPFDPVPKAIEKIDKVIGSLNNKYNLDRKREVQDAKKEKKNVFKVVAAVEQILERSIPNINEISVTQWLAYEELANEKAAAQKNLKTNGKSR